MERRNQRNLLLALILLLAALAVVLVKNRAFWFGVDEASDVDESSPAPVPGGAAPAPPARVSTPAPVPTATPVPAPVSKPAAVSVPASATASNHTATTPASRPKPGNSNSNKEKKEVAAAKVPTESAPAKAVETPRAQLPPIEVEVVSGDKHRPLAAGSNSIMVEIPKHSPPRTPSPAFKWSPASNAAELTRVSSDQDERMQQERPYPALSRQMRVEGSVLLQAFVAPDGGISDLRVLSGNPILASAAVDAARQWRFAPYLQNGRPVATQAKIVVNFTIKVL
jgi:protein TonB